MSQAFIRRIEIEGEGAARESYPLNLPAFRGVRTLDLDPQVTIFVGENGSGKSTLVEAIAVAAGFNAVVHAALSERVAVEADRFRRVVAVGP